MFCCIFMVRVKKMQLYFCFLNSHNSKNLSRLPSVIFYMEKVMLHFFVFPVLTNTLFVCVSFLT